jgi:hypothetical protein
MPIDDVVEHTEKHCICKPRYKFENTPTGIATIVSHHSLDGREGTWTE